MNIFAITVNKFNGFETFLVRAKNESEAKDTLEKQIGWLGDKPTIEDINQYLNDLCENTLKLERDWK